MRFMESAVSAMRNDREPLEFDFSGQEELLAHEHIQAYAKNQHDDKPFHQFSLQKGWLMAEYDDGYSWVCVGEVSSARSLQFPEWTPRYRKQ